MPLNEQGRLQAKETGEKLKGREFAVVYALPLKRARETAEIILAEAGIDKGLILEDLLMERDFGELTGVEYDEEFWRKVDEADEKDWRENPEGIETVPAMMERAEEFWAKMKEKYGDEAEILAVTHGGLMRAMKLMREAKETKGNEQKAEDVQVGNGEVLEIEI